MASFLHLICRDLANIGLKELPSDIFDSLTLLTDLCVLYSEAPFFENILIVWSFLLPKNQRLAQKAFQLNDVLRTIDGRLFVLIFACQVAVCKQSERTARCLRFLDCAPEFVRDFFLCCTVLVVWSFFFRTRWINRQKKNLPHCAWLVWRVFQPTSVLEALYGRLFLFLFAVQKPGIQRRESTAAQRLRLSKLAFSPVIACLYKGTCLMVFPVSGCVF